MTTTFNSYQLSAALAATALFFDLSGISLPPAPPVPPCSLLRPPRPLLAERAPASIYKSKRVSHTGTHRAHTKAGRMFLKVFNSIKKFGLGTQGTYKIPRNACAHAHARHFVFILLKLLFHFIRKCMFLVCLAYKNNNLDMFLPYVPLCACMFLNLESI